MRSFLFGAATGGLALGALAAYLPIEARQERIWHATRFTPSYQVPVYKAPKVNISKRALPKLKIEVAEVVVEPENWTVEPSEREEARAAAIRYALAHSRQKTTFMRPSR